MADNGPVVLVFGGRDYHEQAQLFRVLDDLWPCKIIHGGAKGADFLAGRYAKIKGLDCETFDADWQKHGRAAGPMRNQQMADARPDIAVACAGGVGTADMTRRVRAARIPLIQLGNLEAEGLAAPAVRSEASQPKSARAMKAKEPTTAPASSARSEDA